jgi:hypothetical protein
MLRCRYRCNKNIIGLFLLPWFVSLGNIILILSMSCFLISYSAAYSFVILHLFKSVFILYAFSFFVLKQRKFKAAATASACAAGPAHNNSVKVADYLDRIFKLK